MDNVGGNTPPPKSEHVQGKAQSGEEKEEGVLGTKRVRKEPGSQGNIPDKPLPIAAAGESKGSPLESVKKPRLESDEEYSSEEDYETDTDGEDESEWKKTARKEFSHAVAYVEDSADCGKTPKTYDDFWLYNSELYPDYGTSLVMLFGELDQKTIPEEGLKSFFYEAASRAEIANQFHEYYADSDQKSLEEIVKAVMATLKNIEGALDADKLDEALGSVLKNSRGIVMQEYGKLHHEKGLMASTQDSHASCDSESDLDV